MSEESTIRTEKKHPLATETTMKQITPRQLPETASMTVIENSAMSEITNRVDFNVLVDAVETALLNERERCAKVAELHFDSDAHKQHRDRCDKAIARAIREGR